MTKRALIEVLAARYPQYPKRAVAEAVGSVFHSLTDALARGERIELRGFGSFQVADRAARVGRNPRTGAAVSVPAKRVPVFKGSKALRARGHGHGPGDHPGPEC